MGLEWASANCKSTGFSVTLACHDVVVYGDVRSPNVAYESASLWVEDRSMMRSYGFWRSAIVGLCAFAALAAVSGAWAADDQPNSLYRNSYALLIGINEYQNVPKLEYAVNDVKALRDVLVKSYGFDAAKITVLTDAQATKDGITRALARVTGRARVQREDRILIYFSGHGQTVPTYDGGSKGFLIPVDAQVNLNDLSDPEPYLSTCFPMNAVWETLDLCPAKHVLLIADACYGGLLARTRNLGAIGDVSAQALAKRKARQVMTGGGSGERTFEDPKWGHGAFTYKLLDELQSRAREPGAVFTTQELFVALQRSVSSVTKGRQTPQLADRDTEGEFLFTVPGSSQPDVVATPRPKPDVPVETKPVEPVATTGSIKVTSNPAGAEVYIDDQLMTGKTTPCEVEVKIGEAKSKKVEIALKLDGYKDAVYTIAALRGKLVGLNGKLDAKPVSKPVVVMPPRPVLPPLPSPEVTTPAMNIGEISINPKDGAEMILIPAGKFSMGSTDADVRAQNNEKPLHTVYLDGYWIYRYEVTVAQYRKFCSKTGRSMPNAPSWGWVGDHPMVNVTWLDAADYAKWAGAALPTEAQWEKAARGTDGRIYPWGKAWDPDKCQNSAQRSASVGSFPSGASPYGCLDMAGNAMEWCSDWYDENYYSRASSRNPTGRYNGTYRVQRGGSYISSVNRTRCAYRVGGDPDYNSDNFLGFRCAIRHSEP